MECKGLNSAAGVFGHLHHETGADDIGAAQQTNDGRLVGLSDAFAAVRVDADDFVPFFDALAIDGLVRRPTWHNHRHRGPIQNQTHRRPHSCNLA